MFVAVLFTIAEIWKQPRNSLVAQWLGLHAFTAETRMHRQMDGERKCDTHRNILQLLKKRLAMCNNMDESEGHHAKWNKPDTGRQMLCDLHICGI